MEVEPGVLTRTERAGFDRFGRRSVETAVAFTLSAGANSLYLLVVARLLGPSGTGVVSVAILLASGLAFIVSGALALANVYFGAREPETRGQLLSNSLLFSAIAGVLASIVVFGILVVSGVQFGADAYELAAALAAAPLIGGSRLVQSLVIASGRTRAYNLLTATGPLATLIFGILALAALGSSVSVALGAYAVSQLLVFAISVLGAGIAPEHPSRALLRRSLGYGLRGFVGNFIQIFNYRLDLFLVSALRGASAAGVYSISVFLAEMLWKIAAAASTILFPRVAADRQPAPEFTLRVGRVVVLLTALAAIATIPLTWLVVLPLLPSGFSGALAPLALLLPGVVALALAQVLAADLSGRGKPGYGSYASAIGLGVTLTLTPALVAAYGATGGALASTASYAASGAFLGWIFVRTFRVPLSDLVVPRRYDLRRAPVRDAAA